MLDIIQGILLVLVFFCGAAFASFSGLVAYRLSKAKSDDNLLKLISFPGSHCEHCGRQLSIIDLIPVFGWLIGAGRCRTCHNKVPVLYPVIEALVGLVSVAATILFHDTVLDTVLVLGLLWSLVVISAIDWSIHIIPDELTWPLLFVGLLASPFEPDISTRVAGAALGCGLMWVSLVVTGLLKRQDTTAGGDVALAAVCGAWLGLYVEPVMLFVTCLVFALISVPRHRRGELWTPMAPAFAAATILILPFCDKIPHLYGL